MKVWVAVDNDSLPTEIFRSRSESVAALLSGHVVHLVEMDKAKATKAIRNILFVRQDGICIQCGAVLTTQTAHMHEKVSRGDGGHISLDNSEILCAECHLGRQHGDRNPQFKKVLDKQNEL